MSWRERCTPTAKGRRRVHAIVFLAWLGPGAYLSIRYAHSIAWVVFMSWFACLYAAASAHAAETPVESEGDE